MLIVNCPYCKREPQVDTPEHNWFFAKRIRCCHVEVSATPTCSAERRWNEIARSVLARRHALKKKREEKQFRAEKLKELRVQAELGAAALKECATPQPQLKKGDLVRVEGQGVYAVTEPPYALRTLGPDEEPVNGDLVLVSTPRGLTKRYTVLCAYKHRVIVADAFRTTSYDRMTLWFRDGSYVLGIHRRA